MNIPAICIMGPTASGKTELALTLSKQFPVEIINVDSAQIYRGMNIGAGKVTQQEQRQVPHHLIDILDPKDPYSAAQFSKDALQIIAQIRQRHAIPLLVGGTMMYFKALQEGLSPLPGSNPFIRAQLNDAADNIGLASLYERLTVIDAISASRIKPTDRQRILRALEVFELSQKPFSAWLEIPAIPPACEFLNIALIPIETERADLHERIEKRFDGMLNAGLVNEVQILFERGDLNLSMPSLKAVGYRQVWQYLQNELSYDEMRQQAIVATRQLAKRQLTWLRHWPKITFFDFKDPQILEKVSMLIA